MSLFAELNRRNVFRVGLAYAISAWVLLQVADLVLENTDSPAWVMHVFMIAAVLGLVVALIVSWVYEVTPEGIKREQDVDRRQSITHKTAQKLDYLTLGAAMLVVVLFAVDRMFPSDEAQPVASVPQSPLEALVQPPAETALSNEVEQPSPAAVHSSEMMQALPGQPVVERGVAVLPFANLSADESNVYFAGGMHEDVLTHLSRIGDLKIISRTTMERIAERGLDIREIGRQLGVSHVLEGSVRRAGQDVRVTVQLIDASTDEHLWAENYDRTLDDIFAIQSEIAISIAAQLQAELSPQAVELIDEVPTQNLQAYDLLQEARELNRVWLGAAGFRQQIELLEQAVALDPDYLDAQVMLANAYGRLVWTGGDLDGSAREAADSLTRTIMQTWPERPEARLAQAAYHYTVERDYERAREQLMALLPELPNQVLLYQYLAGVNKRLEDFEQSIKYVDQGLELDPENPSINGERAFSLLGLGRTDEALEWMRETLRRFPDSSLLSSLAYFSLALRGDTEEFYEAWDRLQAQAGNRLVDFDGQSTLPQVWRRMRLAELGVDALLERLQALQAGESPWSPVIAAGQMAELLILAGEPERAQAQAVAGLEQAQTNLSEGVPLPGNVPKRFYTNLAYLACLAGDQGAFNRYRSFSRSLPRSEPMVERGNKVALAMATAACGEPVAGFKLLLQAEHDMFGVTDWLLALDPIYAHYFGALPQFQQRVAPLLETATSE